jgi:transposase
MAKKVNVNEYDLLVPMDVDKKSIHAVIMTQDKIIRKVTSPYDPANIVGYIRKKFAGKRVLFAYEAGPTGYGLYDHLTEQKLDCLVAVPSMIPKAPGQRVKTNRLDARQLGYQIKSGDLKYVEVPEVFYRDLRQLVRLRCRYGKGLIATKTRIKSLFLLEGITFPKGKWSAAVIQQIKQIRSRSIIDFKIAELLKDLEYYRRQEIRIKAEIRRFCRSNAELKANIAYLMSLPGVGWIVSSYVLAALGGIKHLKRTASSCHFFGLGPREHSTGEKIRRGQITAIGDPVARKIIIQGAWVAIRKDVELQEFFWQVYFRNPKQIAKQKAIVAVARKLVCRMHAVLRDQKFFESRNEVNLTV